MKLCSPIYTRSTLLSLLLSALTCAALAQSAPSNQNKSLDQRTSESKQIVDTGASEELKPGIVVERVAKNSEAERAGMQRGDVLLSWSRGDAKGEFASPFDLSTMGTEQTPYGSVTLEGVRGTKRMVWVLGWNSWGIEVWANFAQDYFNYLEGQELANTGKTAQSVERWHRAAVKARGVSPAWLSAWLYFRLARILADGRQWKEAEESYQTAAEQARRDGPVITAYIFYWWAYDSCYHSWPQDDWTKTEMLYQQAIMETHGPGTPNLTTASYLQGYGNSLFFHRSDLSNAIKYFRQSLEIDEKLAPDSLATASRLSSLATAVFENGDLAEAEKDDERALTIMERLAPSSTTTAIILYDLSRIAFGRGDLANADRYGRQALKIEEINSDTRFHCLNILGVTARHRGDLTQAEEYYRDALTIERKASPNSLDTAETLRGLGDVARQQFDPSVAEMYFRQALEFLEKQNSVSTSYAYVHDLYLSYTLDSLGELAEDTRKFAKAAEYYQQALGIKEKQSPRSIEVGNTLNHLGDVARRFGDLAKAEQHYRRAFSILDEKAPQSIFHTESLAGLAMIMQSRQESDTAAQFYEQALNGLENQAIRSGNVEEFRANFRAKYAAYYTNYVDLLIKQKQLERAFRVLERLRARSLLESLQPSPADIHKGADPASVGQLRSLQESINARSHRRMELLSDKKNTARVATLDKEISDLLEQYKDVEGQIRASSPSYAALTQPQPLSAKDVQQRLLDADTVLLEYSLGNERSYVFSVTSDSPNAYQLPGRDRIERLARRTYALLTEHNRRIKGETKQQRQMRSARAEIEYSHTVAELSNMVLGPVARQLQFKRLLIVSDGALQYIPFAVLPAPGKLGSKQSVPLVAEHEIVNLPSASVLAVLRQQESERKQASKEIAVLADPVFETKDERVNIPAAVPQSKANRVGAKQSSDASEESDLDRSAKQLGISGFSRLPFTRREADAIYTVTEKNDALEALDFDASKATALSLQLKDYRIVHFATHGLLNNDHPELSGLVLSLVDRNGNQQDGFLRMLDIYNMDLNAELVVLSACQTALGKEIGEEGLIGLTRGFMYAGAPRVVASLWKVDDEATAELMKKFYEGVLRDHETPARALRGAQQWMRTQKQWQAPYYWAGFVLQGEWR
jgi:CHAT domain-containing protein/Tfp pilus assembly protein PilF